MQRQIGGHLQKEIADEKKAGAKAEAVSLKPSAEFICSLAKLTFVRSMKATK